jgi:MFS family permease
MRRIYAIIFSHSCNQALFAGSRFLASIYAVKLGASPFMVGVLVALFSLAPALFTVPAGRWIDRIGTRLPMRLFMAALVGITLLPFLWPGLEALFIASPVIGGAFFSIYLGIGNLLNHHSEKAERAGNFSKLSVGISVAQGVGPLLGGLCADQFGFGPAFAMVAVFPLIGYLSFSLAGGVGHVPGRREEAGAPAKKGRLADLLGNRDLRSVYLFSTLFILSWDIFIVMLPIYGTQLGFSASELGLVMSAYAVASFTVRVAGTWLSRRYTTWQLMHIALVITAVSSVIFGFMGTLPLMMALAFCMGVGQGLGSPMAAAALYEVAPPDRVGEATGLRMSMAMAAQTALPLGVGSMGSLLAASHIFAANGLLLAAGVWIERRQWRRARAKAP